MGAAVEGTADVDRFRAFFAMGEPRLRRALVAAYGPELGVEAAADALTWAWENFARLEAMEAPLGYLWRVGQTSVRRASRRRGREASWPEPERLAAAVGRCDPLAHGPEPGLAAGLSALPERQRVAVLLVHGYGYPLGEAAAVLGCSVSTLRNHARRGVASLRRALGVDLDA